MPTISEFYGILIRMFFNDHTSPRFHAIYGEFQAVIDIQLLLYAAKQRPRGIDPLV